VLKKSFLVNRIATEEQQFAALNLHLDAGSDWKSGTL
jgi:hypothetical protein